jgi:16S rRNA (cytosine967-C5)-methyltransferase
MFATQKLAARTLSKTLAGQNLNVAFSQLWRDEPTLLPRQRGAIQDICYGTLRHLGQLETVLQQLLNKPLHENELKSLLLISLYQLQFTRAAPYAIVDHAVKVAAQTGEGRGKGLVNGVLRSFLRDKDELIRKALRKPYARYSFPDWWREQLEMAYPDQWSAILKACNQHPPMTLRVNRRRSSGEDYLQTLLAQGLQATLLDDQTVLLKQPLSVDELPGFRAGQVSVQDWGAQFAAPLLDVRDGMRVLDACAAPGGKTGHLLELADLDLTAIDADEIRLKRVRENLDRLQLQAKLLTGDASQPVQWWDGQPFDRILADVPCSATGVVRRHPDIKWLRRPEDFANFARQQAAMLDALWPLLAPGGKLLYATCSIFPVENAAQATAFAARHPDAERLVLPEQTPSDGQLLPTAEHDGFYYALFRKTA